MKSKKGRPHTLYISDEAWQKALDKTIQTNESISEVVSRLLIEWTLQEKRETNVKSL